VTSYLVTGRISKQKNPLAGARFQAIAQKFSFLRDLKFTFSQNKYQITVALLSIFVLFMLYSLLSQIFHKPVQEVYVNSQ
jgi:hypothetical protein